MPDAWRCECGYTNLGSKTCMVCRRPRQAVPAREPAARIDEPPPPAAVDEVEPVAKAAKRPLKAAKRPLKKAAPRKRAK
jgi:hypothetical protein